jgi:hypothetical protein
MLKFAVSNVCDAFDPTKVAVGSSVLNHAQFAAKLYARLDGLAMPDGTAMIDMPEAVSDVSCGVAKRSGIGVDGYHVLEWRGEVMLFARREYAAQTQSVNVLVYTAERYVNDPQVKPAEVERIGDATHVVVAVLAAAGPKPPLSSHRFVRNLAGGNPRYSPANGYTIEAAVKEAAEIAAYEQEWVTVAG